MNPLLIRKRGMMQTTQGGGGSISLNIYGYDQNDYNWGSIADYDFIGRGYTSTASTRVNVTTSGFEEAHIYLLFDTSSIPFNAVITSATLNVKASIQTTSEMQAYTCSACNSKVAVDTVNMDVNSGNIVYTFDLSSWSRADIELLSVYLYYKRGSQANVRYFYIYGATLDVTWS